MSNPEIPLGSFSAKYGLVVPDVTIAPYEKTLKSLPVAERRTWAKGVIAQLDSNLLNAERVVVLAGVQYRQFLMEYLRHRFPLVEVPMEGLAFGQQLEWLGRQ